MKMIAIHVLKKVNISSKYKFVDLWLILQYISPKI